MATLVDLQIVPNRVFQAVKERILANRARYLERLRQAEARGPTRPRVQRLRFNASLNTYRRPEPSAQRGGLLSVLFRTTYKTLTITGLGTGYYSDPIIRLTTESNAFNDEQLTTPPAAPAADPADPARFESYIITAIRMRRWSQIINGARRYYEVWEARVRTDSYLDGNGGTVSDPFLPTTTWISALYGHRSSLKATLTLASNPWGYGNVNSLLNDGTVYIYPVYPDAFQFSFKPQAEQYPPVSLQGAAWDASSIDWTPSGGTVTPIRSRAYSATETRTVWLPAGGKHLIFVEIATTAQRTGYWNNTVYFPNQTGSTTTSMSPQVATERVSAYVTSSQAVRQITAPEKLLAFLRQTMRTIQINPMTGPYAAISYTPAVKPWPWQGLVEDPVPPSGRTLQGNVLAFWPKQEPNSGDPDYWSYIFLYLWSPKIFYLLNEQPLPTIPQPPSYPAFVEQEAAISDLLYADDFGGGDFELHQFWDWGQPGLCRQQLLALGFQPADLQP